MFQFVKFCAIISSEPEHQKKGGDTMTAREEIALKLTEANIDKIAYLSKHENSVSTVDILANDVKEFYNYLYENIMASDNTPIDF